MLIVDTHMHLYDFRKGVPGGNGMSPIGFGKVMKTDGESRTAPPSFDDCVSSAEIAVAYMDWCGVDKGIIMANPYYGYFNSYIEEAVEKFPDRFRGVALVDILKGREAARELENIYQKGILFGMAVETANTFFDHPGARLTDAACHHVWNCMAAYSQPLFAHIFTQDDLEDISLLSTEYPDITFILCHIGADAVWGADAAERSFARLCDIVNSRNNVYVDLSSIPDYLNEEYPFPTAAARIEDTWRAIGAEKMLWATDYPGMLTQATYKQLIKLVTDECRSIPASEKELIMGQNAIKLLFE